MEAVDEAVEELSPPLLPGLGLDAPAPSLLPSAALLPLAFPPAVAVPLLPPRKSVTYQPDPLSWNPAAVTCLEKASAPQAGQVLNAGSDSFCSTSLL